MPAVPPYSSTTTARWLRASRRSASTPCSERVSGTTTTSVMSSLDRWWSTGSTGARPCTLLTSTTPTMSSRSVRYTGKRENPVLGRPADQVGRRAGRWPAPTTLHPRHQGVGRGLVGEAHRAGEQRRRGVADRALLGRRLEQPGQLGQRAHRLELLLGLDAEQAHRPVGGPVEQADQRAEHGAVDPQERREEQRRRLGLGHRHRLGGQLAHHHLQHRGEHQGDGHRHRPHRRRADDRLEQRLDQLGDHRLGQEAQQQRGDGDAELRARQLERQVAQQRLHQPGPPRSLLGQARRCATGRRRRARTRPPRTRR